jgi:hypothetical protein
MQSEACVLGRLHGDSSAIGRQSTLYVGTRTGGGMTVPTNLARNSNGQAANANLIFGHRHQCAHLQVFSHPFQNGS